MTETRASLSRPNSLVGQMQRAVLRPPLEHEAWEAEALGQGTIQQLVRAALDSLLPEPLAAVRAHERERIARLLDDAKPATSPRRIRRAGADIRDPEFPAAATRSRRPGVRPVPVQVSTLKPRA